MVRMNDLVACTNDRRSSDDRGAPEVLAEAAASSRSHVPRRYTWEMPTIEHKIVMSNCLKTGLEQERDSYVARLQSVLRRMENMMTMSRRRM
jgi:hypothetical protein